MLRAKKSLERNKKMNNERKNDRRLLGGLVVGR